MLLRQLDKILGIICVGMASVKEAGWGGGVQCGAESDKTASEAKRAECGRPFTYLVKRRNTSRVILCHTNGYEFYRLLAFLAGTQTLYPEKLLLILNYSMSPLND